MTDAERAHFLLLAGRLGRDRTVAYLTGLGVAKFSEIPLRTERAALLLAMTQELFNATTD